MAEEGAFGQAAKGLVQTTERAKMFTFGGKKKEEEEPVDQKTEAMKRRFQGLSYGGAETGPTGKK